MSDNWKYYQTMQPPVSRRKELVHRIVLAILREIARSQHTDLIRDHCRELFVSKGRINGVFLNMSIKELQVE